MNAQPIHRVSDESSSALVAFTLPSPLGRLCGVASPSGVCLLTFAPPTDALTCFPADRRAELMGSLHELAEGAEASSDHQLGEPLSAWLGDLRRYLHGKSRSLAIPVDLRLARTPFHHAVYEELLRVQPGQTTTYGDLARLVGRPLASRAIGQAVGKNPIALIVPCHRVLGRDGSLHGFAFGLAKKAALLKLEGVDPALGGASRSWDREVRADSR